ncbi:MAG: hypothetical protein ACOY46_11590 [Bacillota bacterium]
MPWAITFIVCWVLFFIFVDLRKLKDNIIGGILAVALATFVDNGARILCLYEFNDLIISWVGLPVFYIWGPIFTMGVLFMQYVPQHKWLQALHVLVFSITFAAVDFLLVQVNAADYIHWHWLASFFVNCVCFGSLTWITQAFIRKRI